MAVIALKRTEDLRGDDFDPDTVLDYAERYDCGNFFEALHRKAGLGGDLDDIIADYANENVRELCEYISGD